MKFNYQLQRICGSYYGRPIESSSSNSNATVTTQWSGSNILFYYDHQYIPKTTSTTGTTGTSSSRTTVTTTYIISAICSRIQIINCLTSEVRTVPIETRSNIVYMTIAASASASASTSTSANSKQQVQSRSTSSIPLLVTIDTQNYCMLIHITKNIILHRWKVNNNNSSSSGSSSSTTGYCYCIPQFSPRTSQYLAIGIGTQVQLWLVPSILSSSSTSTSSSSSIYDYCPIQLLRTYTGCTSHITHIEWSFDETVLMVGSNDCSIRLYTVPPIAYDNTNYHDTDTTTNQDNNNQWKLYDPISLLGHKSSIVNTYFVTNNNNYYNNATSNNNSNNSIISTIYSISKDGTICIWDSELYDTSNNDTSISNTNTNTTEMIDTIPNDDDDQDDESDEENDSGSDSSSNNKNRQTKRLKLDNTTTTTTTTDAAAAAAADMLLRTKKYIVSNRIYLQQECINGTIISCTSYCYNSNLLAIGYSNGIFGIYEMPSCSNIHTLSIGQYQNIQTCIFNTSGTWLALGCPISQQLIVWEWQSESYILKQSGHNGGMNSITCMSYSHDSTCIATGGIDGKIKLWNTSTGFCYVTFPNTSSSHTAPITGITFANDSVLISCSYDGTIKAHDLYRYRTFKTYTTPTPVQFTCITVDTSGEMILAGSNDPFHIYCYNIQTGQLLDIFTGHTGPICNVQFMSSYNNNNNNSTTTLVSGSWDGTIKTWDLYKGNNTSVESYQHISDVICIAVSYNHQQICSSTMNGILSFWDCTSNKLQYEITNGKYDLCGGRKLYDRRTSTTNAAMKYFTSICYTPDNTCIIGGGNSKYICIYEISQQILIKKFTLCHNRSIDGILDELHSKNLTDGGPIATPTKDTYTDVRTYNATRLPGSKRGDDGAMTRNVEVRTIQIVFANTGREFSVISEEGLHIYSLDDDMIFNPLSQSDEMITPASIEHKLSLKEYSMALQMALYLNENHIIQNVIEQVPYKSIEFVCRSIYHDATKNSKKQKKNQHHQPLEILLQVIGTTIDETPHIEFYIEWCLQLLQVNGYMIEQNRYIYIRVLRTLHKAIISKRTDFDMICNDNKYMLEFLSNHASLMKEIHITGSSKNNDDTNE